MPYPYKTMSPDELERFLEEPRHAVVATLRADGAPHLSPVWFIFEHGELHLSVQSDSLKYKHLSRDARIAVCVDAAHPDARSVTLDGVARLEPDDQDPTIAAKHASIARRYLETDEAVAQYLARARAASPLVLVSVSPLKLVSRDYNAPSHLA